MKGAKLSLSMPSCIFSDLMVQILNRLPAKSLMRLRSVCKSWKQLIDSTSFILDHLAVQSQRPCILAHKRKERYLLALDPQTLPCTNVLRYPHQCFPQSALVFFLVGSVHGVVCMYNPHTYHFILWNPTIRKSFKIPSYPLCAHFNDFDCAGFWMDPSSKEFKIAVFGYERTKDVQLYSSRKQAWSKVPMLEYYEPNIPPKPQVLIDGVGYWTGYYSGGIHRKVRKVIAFFDFMQEKQGIIELPEGIEGYLQKTVNLCKWHECLSVVYWLGRSPCTCKLWVMQNGSWNNKFNFQFPREVHSVLCVLEGSGKVLASSGSAFKELHLYEPDGGKFIPLEPTFTRKGKISICQDFVESLVFPHPVD